MLWLRSRSTSPTGSVECATAMLPLRPRTATRRIGGADTADAGGQYGARAEGGGFHREIGHRSLSPRPCPAPRSSRRRRHPWRAGGRAGVRARMSRRAGSGVGFPPAWKRRVRRRRALAVPLPKPRASRCRRHRGARALRPICAPGQTRIAAWPCAPRTSSRAASGGTVPRPARALGA